MFRLLVLFAFLAASLPSYGDDAERYPVAMKIKSAVEKKVAKKFPDYQGYCDVTIEMSHTTHKAKIERVKGTGNGKLCNYIKKQIQIGKMYRYNIPESQLRIHIDTR